jgi:ATP-binding cassette subfamily F protein 3
MSVIAVENASKSFGLKRLFTDVTFTISDGEVVALVGSNGCGKTTLIRCIVGLEELDGGRIRMSRNCRIGYLSQEFDQITDTNAYDETIRGLERVLSAEREIKSIEARLSQQAASSDSAQVQALLKRYERAVREFEASDGYNLAFKVRSALMGLGLPEDCLHAPIETLSGGEKMRVALARLLLSEPDVLILDEPTNHLDMPATEWLEGFLRGFAGSTLIVSHDRYFLDQIADRVLDMDRGTVTSYTGNYSSFARKKLGRIAEARQTYERQRQERKRTELLVQRLRDIGKIRMAKSRVKLMQNQEPVSRPDDRVDAPRFVFTNAKHVSDLVAKVSHMSKRYGERVIFDNISFTIRGGEKVGIIGPNGVGKSTLLRILLGLEPPDRGQGAIGSWVKYSYFSQDSCDLDEDKTVLETITTATQLNDDEARQYLARFLFRGENVQKRVSVLSGGERSRLILCRTILEEPYCLVLDEPTNHLDVESRECLEDALRSFAGTVIAVSHDRYFLNKVATRILEIRDCKVYSYHGNYAAYKKQLLTDKTQSSTAARPLRSAQAKSAPVRSGRVGARSHSSEVRATSKLDADDLEAEILALEERAEALEKLFADTDFYKTPDCYRKLQEHEQIMERLRVLYDACERL